VLRVFPDGLGLPPLADVAGANAANGFSFSCPDLTQGDPARALTATG